MSVRRTVARFPGWVRLYDIDPEGQVLLSTERHRYGMEGRSPETGALDVILEVMRRLGVPLVTGLPFGHVRANFPWPVGGRATIDGDAGEIRMTEQGVRRAA